MSIETFGLWWLIVATTFSQCFTVSSMVGGRIKKGFGFIVLFWGFVYIWFYLYLLGVFA